MGKEAEAQAEQPAYFQQLPPDVVSEHGERLAKHGPKLGDLANATLAQEDKLARSVTVPNAENPDPEELAAFQKAMGLPEKPDGYEIDTATAKGMEGLVDVVASVRGTAADMALSNTQAQKLFDYLIATAKTGREANETAGKELVESFDARLLDALGNDQEKATQTMNLFKAFMVTRVADSDVVKKLADAGLFYDPRFAIKMAQVEATLSEEQFIAGGGPREGGPKKIGSMGHYSDEWRDGEKGGTQ